VLLESPGVGSAFVPCIKSPPRFWGRLALAALTLARPFLFLGFDLTLSCPVVTLLPPAVCSRGTERANGVQRSSTHSWEEKVPTNTGRASLAAVAYLGKQQLQRLS